MDMHNELYWTYRAYSVLIHHGPTWTDNQIDYLENLIKNIRVMEEYFK
jgi:hypothetical protein